MSLGATRTFPAGAVILRQGDPGGAEAYLVREGTVQIRREPDGHVLRTLRPGDLLGEVAVFRATGHAGAVHSATAVALEPVTLMVIPADRLEDLVRSHPALALAIIRELARMIAGEANDATE